VEAFLAVVGFFTEAFVALTAFLTSAFVLLLPPFALAFTAFAPLAEPPLFVERPFEPLDATEPLRTASAPLITVSGVNSKSDLRHLLIHKHLNGE
jgi:hypothetical protein